MSDFDDSLSPRDPEIEYANQARSVREGYYGTGDTTPPKDHVGVISLVLILLVSLSSLLGVLSLMNIEVFREPQPTELSAPVSFYVSADGVLTAELEPREPAVTEPPVLEGIDLGAQCVAPGAQGRHLGLRTVGRRRHLVRPRDGQVVAAACHRPAPRRARCGRATSAGRPLRSVPIG